MAGEKWIDRRTVLKTIGAGSVASITGLSGCLGGDDGEYPSREIELVIPFGPGGGFGAISQTLEPYWGRHLPNDQVVTLEFVQGAGGLVGTEQVWNADPDGYTFMLMYPLPMITHELYGDVSFTTRDFSYLGLLTADPDAMLAREDLGINSWDDFASQAEDLVLASPGAANNGHLHPIIYGNATGDYDVDELTFVQFNDVGSVLQAVASGEADVMFIAAPTAYREANAFEELDLTFVFTDSESGAHFSDLDPIFIDQMDADGLEDTQLATTFPRFYAGPPDMDDTAVEVLQDTLDAIINDEEAMDALNEVHQITGPVASSQAVLDIIDAQFEAYQEEPLATIIQEAIG